MTTKLAQNFIAFFFTFLFGFFLSSQLIEVKWLLLPIPIILTFFIYYLFRLDQFLMFIVFCSPFSLSLTELGFFFENVDISFPTEFFLFGFLFIVSFKIFYQPELFKKILGNKITFYLFIYLLWMFVCSVTSTMPFVSLKLFITRLWYIIPCFIFATLIFYKNHNRIVHFVVAYCISFSVVIIHTLIKHSVYSFSGPSSNWVVAPFFDDHTSYGAMLAFFIPILALFFSSSKIKISYRVISFFCFVLFSIALIFSYTRAAWVSLFGAIILGLFVKFKFQLKHFIMFSVLVLFILFPFRHQIFSIVSDNKQDSSSSLTEHVRSIYNIKSDASNMERINRWNCALSMFKEKPILGFGPGTYQFQYGIFQMHKDKTIISTNSGDMGNAHSEYLGALSETGLIGLSLLLLLITTIFKKGISLYYSEKTELLKTYLLGSMIGLMTYFIHGLFNNFLDMDKAAIPLWFFVAIIVYVDMQRSKI